MPTIIFMLGKRIYQIVICNTTYYPTDCRDRKVTTITYLHFILYIFANDNLQWKKCIMHKFEYLFKRHGLVRSVHRVNKNQKTRHMIQVV